jgi:hypothetical protein
MSNQKPAVMKNGKYKFIGIAGFAILFGILVVFSGCKKSEDDNSGPSAPQPYSNLSDDTTTSIIASIPRIDLKQVKSNQISVYLSVTDQKGMAFGAFNQYNFVFKMVCVGSTDTIIIGSLQFQKLNQTGQNIATPLVLDYSGSMGSYISDLEFAASKFIKVKNRDDVIELIKFSSDVERVLAFTKDTTALLAKLYEAWPGAGGITAFYDAVILGIDDATAYINASSGHLPAVIGFTDGQDNNSTHSMQDAIDQAKIAGIPLYMLGFGSADPTRLTEMADQTGGRYYYAPDPQTIENIFLLISGQLRNVYMATWGYTSSGCNQALVIVDATYTCKQGTFKSRAMKVFNP